MRAAADIPAMPADPSISDAAKDAPDATSFSDEINQKIGGVMDKLVKNSDDKPTVSMVRNWLINEDPATASTSYQNTYTAALNTVFVGLLSQGDPPVSARLNMALVIRSLAGQKANLAPALIKLLGDKSPAVVYISVQAAKLMLPLALKSQAFVAGPCVSLLDAIIKSVKDSSDSSMAGLIASEAYKAMNPRQWTSGGMPDPVAMAPLIGALLKLQSTRLELYKTSYPPNPVADTYAEYLLLTPDGWNVMSQDQQLQAVQNAANLVSWAGQRAGNLRPDQVHDLIDALTSEGYWMGEDGLGKITQDDQLKTAGAALHNLSAAAPAESVKAVSDALIQELTQIPAFQGLKPPADLSAASTAPSPASTEAAQ
jgi:hypothetical protein